jgi:DNA helicase-2/ATP-dependent DNA helicase PcrA
VNLTETQRKIAEAPLGPILVTAGAGSGKTRTLTHRLLHLIRTGIPDHKIVALTFTNKAGNEMRSRVEKLLGRPFSTFIGTFHSFCTRFLRKNWPTPNFSIYSAADTNKVLKDIIGGDKELLRKAQYHLGEWKNEGKPLDTYIGYIKWDNDSHKIEQILREYRHRLKANNAMDFDDLLLCTLKLFQTQPDILDKLQAGFSYILVDEFQDTNEIQYKIVSALAKIHKNIMAVGDEDQCIYSWRGASIENIQRFKHDFPDVKIYKLEENFRSSKNIVELASSLVSKNSNRIKKVLFSSIPDGNINFECCYNENQEADRVIAKIIENKRSGGRWSDTAILMRINALSRVFEERLRRYNIPYVIWGGFKFYERAEVKAALDYLRVIVNPNDDVSLFNVINFPRRGIGDAGIEKIKSAAKDAGVSCYNYIHGTDNTKIKEFVRVLDELAEANRQGLAHLAQNFVYITGLKKHYEEDKNDGENRLENLYQLSVSITEFAVREDAELADYLQTVSISGGEDPESNEQVVISTVHSAKGLEFKTVFVVGMEDGIFPTYRSRDDDGQMEEERRLLYVAITRAMRNLHISFAKNRFINGDHSRMKRSNFLTELGYFGGGDEFSYYF